MNSLQAGLIGVSVLVIALFAAWMWWQSWRSSREQQERAAERRVEMERLSTERAGQGSTERANQSSTERASGGRTDPVLNTESSTRSNWTAPPPLPEPTLATHSSVSQLGNSTAMINTQSGEAPRAVEVDVRVEIEPQTRAISHDEFVPEEPRINAESAAASAVAFAPKSAQVPTTLPLDDRINVYAIVNARTDKAIDCQDFVSLADRSLAWGRVFRMSAWEYIDSLADGGAVQSLCLGMPIATRAGPVSTSDALGWKNEVSVIAGRHELDVSFGGDVSVGERAAELDQFLAATDVICVLYLVRKDGGAWSGTRLRGTLEANGFRLQADGRFVYFEVESEMPIFSAVDGFERSFTPERLRTENVNALRLVFEASNVVNPVARFDVYRQTLRALARLLESDIKDSDGTNVGDNEFAAMREEVVAGSQALADAGIECGSPTAHSLFR